MAEWPGASARGGLAPGLWKGPLPVSFTGHLGHLGALLGLTEHHWPSCHSQGTSRWHILCASAREEGTLWSSAGLLMLRVKRTEQVLERGDCRQRGGNRGSGWTLPPGLLHYGFRGRGEIRETFSAVSPAGLQAPSLSTRLSLKSPKCPG